MFFNFLHNFLFRPFYWFSSTVENLCKRTFKFDHYEVAAGKLMRQNGPFSREFIDIERIEEWFIVNEMIFDVVFIKVFDNGLCRWLDYDRKLTSILRKVAWQKEKRNGTSS